jgi:diaminohydroxyphosphoribosylaminopyrimidine deaminase/5-amino-6-(5-phosphoribosylamino)uracil reductase
MKTDFEGNVKYIALEDFNYYVPQYILYQLYLQDVQSVIIEGGAHTLNTFIEAGLWDEARVFSGKLFLGEGIKAPLIKGKLAWSELVGSDELNILYNVK